MELIIPILLWLLSLPITASMAGSRNRSTIGWFFMAFFFGPLAILLIALVGRKGSGYYCPHCRMEIHPAATICPHCRTHFGQTQ